MNTFSNTFLIALLAVLTVKISENAKILALYPLPAGSHMNIIKALVDPLLQRGHEIDLVSFFPLGIKNKRFLDIDISGSFPSAKNNLTIVKPTIGNPLLMAKLLDYFALPVLNQVFRTKAIINLKNSQKKYDLIIRHILLSDPFEAFAFSFNAPSIGIITSVNVPWIKNVVGLPDNPAYIPNVISSYGENMNYFQRVYNTILYVFFKLKYSSYLKDNDKLTQNFFGSGTPPLEDILKRMSLILCNSHFTIHQSRLMPPNFIEIGGLHIHGKQNDSVSTDLQETLDSSPQGIIYVSFGSMVKSENLQPTLLKAMFDTLGVLPHKILWKGDKNSISKILKIPTNFHVESWMPQFAILRHPNTKLFVTHGGLFGIQEAVYFGVPILGIPLMIDQGSNLQLLVEKNVALYMAYENISKGSFSEAINTLLQEKYKVNAEDLSRRFKDRPTSPLDTAIYWIEYVIKYNGAPFLKSAVTKLEWYQYFLLDVIAGLLIMCLLVCVVAYLVIGKLYKLLVLLINKYVSKRLKRKIKSK